jgi:hypothetical protein
MKEILNLPKKCLKITNKTVHVALSGGFMNDVLVVVVTETAAEFFVVHFWFVLADAPSSCNLRMTNI